MCVPAARQFQGLASWLGSCAGVIALVGKLPVGGGVNELFTGGEARQCFDEIALCRSQSDVAQLSNPLAVENIHTVERAARNDSGAWNEYRPSCAISELGRSIHARARLA